MASHGEHESGALGQPLVFKDRRGSRMPGRANSQDGAGGKGGSRGLTLLPIFNGGEEGTNQGKGLRMFPGWCSGMESGFLLKTGLPARVQESWPELSGLRPNWNKRGKDSLLFTLTGFTTLS